MRDAQRESRRQSVIKQCDVNLKLEIKEYTLGTLQGYLILTGQETGPIPVCPSPSCACFLSSSGCSV